MNVYSDPKQLQANKTAANNVTREQSGAAAFSSITDNRAEAIAQRHFRKLSNNSSSSKQIAQLKSCAKPTVQLGRSSAFGDDKHIVKLVLPGSGDLHWRTRTDEQKKAMELLPATPGQAWVRRQEGKNKVEYSVAGPQALGGASDTGANSIRNNIARGVALVEAEVKRKVGENIKPENIVILIKAHSRNAVASSQVAKTLSEQFSELYNRYFKPRIELVMLDPVPGPGHTGELNESDISAILSSTLVYSLITQYALGFGPQKITGAKRLIISQQDHGTGTTSSFQYDENLYKGSNLNSLPNGVFIGAGFKDNIETIERITKADDLASILEQAAPVTQKIRLKIIEEVANTFGLTAPSRGSKKDD